VCVLYQWYSSTYHGTRVHVYVHVYNITIWYLKNNLKYKYQWYQVLEYVHVYKYTNGNIISKTT
jgi:hypothetical protein